MAKVRGVPRSFVDGKGVPGQYTTDPAVAPASQVAEIGKSIDKAKRLSRGQVETGRMPQAGIAVKNIASAAKVRGESRTPAPSSVLNSGISGGSAISTSPTKVNSSSGGRGTPIKKNYTPLQMDKLTESQSNSVTMLKKSLEMQDVNPEEHEEFKLYGEILTRKQQLEPEQNRLRSIFRRFDRMYHPDTITLGGADHWAEDPSARLAGRAHVSVNVHAAYVNIPSSLQAVVPVIHYIPEAPTEEAREDAANRERLFFSWWHEQNMDLKLETAALTKSLYGYTAAKVYWDANLRMPSVNIIEQPENLYMGFGNSDYTRLDWALYCYGLSPQAVKEDFGIDIIPVKQGEKWFGYSTSGTHDDPLGTVYQNQFERNPLRRETVYEQLQVEVYDYWYKVPTSAGKPPMVWNAIYVGNTLVKHTRHPEYAGSIPYVMVQNGKVPGSPYGKPELYDVEQLLREKDERITNQAQMIQSVVGGQMWQLIGAEAPDEVPPNALPKPNKVAAPGPGNELRALQPFIPQFQIEDYNKRIDREIAVVTGLNDLLLGLAPTSVLGSSKAIASLIANYESRIAPKRKLFYQWMKDVWTLCGRVWSSKDKAIAQIFEEQYRIDVIPPELTPRDTLELAQTAINLVQNRIWSAERAMDRVGVEDPEGELDIIRDEQTDATINPAAVLTMGNLLQLFQQLQQQGIQAQQLQAQEQAAQSQFQAQQQSLNAFRTLNPPATAGAGLNAFENAANPPAEALPENAEPGAQLPMGLELPVENGSEE
jgi:hypothetical protein